MTRYPEGEEFLLWLTRMMAHMDVCDFGCGDGRLARFFDKKHYAGVDKHPANIIKAMRTNDDYRFACNYTSPIGFYESFGYTLFAHDVMLYIPDKQLSDVVGRFCQPRIIISEALGRALRTAAVFNREIEEYERTFRAAGYRLHRVQFRMPELLSHEIAVLEFHKQ